MKTVFVKTACKVSLVATTFDNGQVMVSPLTECCQGAATGTSSGNLACKGCYAVVPDIYGAAATTQPEVADLVSALGRCHVPSECADEVMWKIEQTQEVSV